MADTLRLDLDLVLPDLPDDQDDCVQRLMTLLEGRDGIRQVHVLRESTSSAAAYPDRRRGAALCLHYDPERLALAQVAAMARQAGAEVSDRYGHAIIPFRMVGSEDRGADIEAGLRRVPGVTSVSVNFPGQVVRVEYDRRTTRLRHVTEQMAALRIYPVQQRAVARYAEETRQRVPERRSWYRRHRELAWSLTAGALLLLGWAVEKSSPDAKVLALLFYVPSYVFGAQDNIRHSFRLWRRGRLRLNIDLLMLLAAAGAAALGEYAEGALLLFLFSLGHALQHYALDRARNAITALADLAPQVATVVRDGVETEVPIAEVRPGDRVVVKPAERIPVDGAVVEGRSAVNQAPITGESVPVEKASGDQLFAGSVNGEGALVVEVTVAVGDRTLDRIVKLVSEAETQKAPTQQFTERFERVFVPVVIAGVVALMTVPPLLGLWLWEVAIYRGLTALIASAPCALALGTPAAVLAGIAQAARRGVLIKGGAHLETLGGIRTLALDKTGTITRGEPRVVALEPVEGVLPSELLTMAAAVERRSQHPLARAITAAAADQGLAVPDAGDVESLTGRGVRARVGGDVVEVGRLLMFEAPPEHVQRAVGALEAAGRTTMVVRRRVAGASGETNDGWLGVIGVADEPRAGVRATLDALRAAGIGRIIMLTGDNAGVAQAVAQSVGIDEVRAGLLPEDKVTAVRELAATGPVAMVGDGVNDAPALAHATLGIAMGGAGTAAALETADMALMSDDLGRLPFAIGLGRRARATIRQNLVISLSVILFLLVASVAGLASISWAVILHEGSTLVVVANGLRLLAYDGEGSTTDDTGGRA